MSIDRNSLGSFGLNPTQGCFSGKLEDVFALTEEEESIINHAFPNNEDNFVGELKTPKKKSRNEISVFFSSSIFFILKNGTEEFGSDNSRFFCRSCKKNIKSHGLARYIHFMSPKNKKCWLSTTYDLSISNEVAEDFYPPNWIEEVQKNLYRCTECNEEGLKRHILTHVMVGTCHSLRNKYKQLQVHIQLETCQNSQLPKTSVSKKLSSIDPKNPKHRSQLKNPKYEYKPPNPLLSTILKIDSRLDKVSQRICPKCKSSLSNKVNLYSHISTHYECWKHAAKVYGLIEESTILALLPTNNLQRTLHAKKWECIECSRNFRRKEAVSHVACFPCGKLRNKYSNLLRL